MDVIKSILLCLGNCIYWKQYCLFRVEWLKHMELPALNKLPFHGLNFFDTEIIMENLLVYICQSVFV